MWMLKTLSLILLSWNMNMDLAWQTSFPIITTPLLLPCRTNLTCNWERIIFQGSQNNMPWLLTSKDCTGKKLITDFIGAYNTMPFIKTGIPDLLIFEPDVYQDNRGYFFESY